MTAPVTPPAPVDLRPYDGIVLLSFGGPEGHEEVLPFLRRVAAGRDIPEARLLEVAEHYHRRGGVSPINAQNRALVAALAAEVRARGSETPVRLANRNSMPFLPDVLREFHDAGARRLLVVLTSAYSSYSSCRQYRENLAEAVATLGPAGADLVIDKVEPWFGLPAFVRTYADHTAAALGAADPSARVLHVTHSVPVAMADSSGPPEHRNLYVDQHERLVAAIDARVGHALGREVESELVYCSRSGPPRQPWLVPDVGDRIRELAAEGVRQVVLVPIGFVSDHMEVVNDLDEEAVAAGREAGVDVVRVPTVGDEPALVAGLVDLMAARAALARGGAAPRLQELPGDVRPPVCAADCCPNPRGPRPALCGVDAP